MNQMTNFREYYIAISKIKLCISIVAAEMRLNV